MEEQFAAGNSVTWAETSPSVSPNPAAIKEEGLEGEEDIVIDDGSKPAGSDIAGASSTSQAAVHQLCAQAEVIAEQSIGGDVGPGISEQFQRVFMNAITSTMIPDSGYWLPSSDTSQQSPPSPCPVPVRPTNPCPTAEPLGMISDDVDVSEVDSESTMEVAGPYTPSDMYDALNPYALFNLPPPEVAHCCSNHDSTHPPYQHVREPSEDAQSCSNSGSRQRAWGSSEVGSDGGRADDRRGDDRGDRGTHPHRKCAFLPGVANERVERHRDVIAKCRTLPPTSLATWTSGDGGEEATPMEEEDVSHVTSPPTCLLLPGPCKKQCTGHGTSSAIGEGSESRSCQSTSYGTSSAAVPRTERYVQHSADGDSHAFGSSSDGHCRKHTGGSASTDFLSLNEGHSRLPAASFTSANAGMSGRESRTRQPSSLALSTPVVSGKETRITSSATVTSRSLSSPVLANVHLLDASDDSDVEVVRIETRCIMSQSSGALTEVTALSVDTLLVSTAAVGVGGALIDI